MESNLKTQFVQAIFRFKKVGLGPMPNLQDINMTELQVMAGISQNYFGVDSHVNLTEIQRRTFVTKAAISKMLTSLERKGFIIRETDKENRRRITVTLTENGKEILQEALRKADKEMDHIISRLGKEDMRQLISLLERVSDIRDEAMHESDAAPSTGTQKRGHQ